MIDDGFIGFLLGAVATFLFVMFVGILTSPRTDKNAFIQRCQSDNGVTIFADKEYCIKRSAFVETVR